jgi:hypothetical protein
LLIAMDELRDKVSGDYDQLGKLLGGYFASLYNSQPRVALTYIAIFQDKFGRKALSLQQLM